MVRLHPVLDLGEGLFGRIEIGEYDGRYQSLASAALIKLRRAAHLWLPRLSMMTMSPG
jgi:hypothetical protein